MGRLVRDARAAVPTIRVAATGSFIDPNFLVQADGAAEETYAVTEALQPESYAGATADWRARYEAQFGPLLSPYALYGFAATNAAREGIRRAGHNPDRAAVRAAVMATQNFASLLGTFSFDADGDTTNSLVSYARFSAGGWAFPARTVA